MPIVARVSSELGLVVLVLEGMVTADEFNLQLIPLSNQPEYNMMPLTLVDMTAAQSTDVPSDYVRQHSRRVSKNIDSKIAGTARTAFVATSDEFFGLSRMYSTLREGSPVECVTFRSLREAEEWLGLPEDYQAKLTDIS